MKSLMTRMAVGLAKADDIRSNRIESSRRTFLRRSGVAIGAVAASMVSIKEASAGTVTIKASALNCRSGPSKLYGVVYTFGCNQYAGFSSAVAGANVTNCNSQTSGIWYYNATHDCYFAQAYTSWYLSYCC